jgi:aryl-alcohol dehydrogenase-like predicted oxidoreductase
MSEQRADSRPGMDYRALGRTGVQVSRLCLGCMNFGGRTSESDSRAIVDRALDAGINFLDTANVYGHEPEDFSVGRGRSEEIVGRALARASSRERVVLATKLHFPMGDDPNDRGSTRRHIIASCEASLRRLGTDWIDLLQLHHPSSAVPIDETLRALDDLVRRGLVRYIGTSSFGAWQIVESLWASKELGLNRFVSEQPAYNLLDRRAERELIPMARTYGLAVLPWSPTGGGLLSGKYSRGAQPSADTRYDTLWGGSDAMFTDQVFDLVEGLSLLAQELGCTSTQLAVAWSAAQPGVTCPIIGPRTVEQLDGYLGALEVELSDEVLARIDELAPPGRETVPMYGADGFAWTTWGPHEHRW